VIHERSGYAASALISVILLCAAVSQGFAQSGPSPQEQQSGPSPQEQMPCRSDAGRYCAEHIGKPPQMKACPRDNKAKLSDGCRKVVESHGG
jgi:hypothetical protein